MRFGSQGVILDGFQTIFFSIYLTGMWDPPVHGKCHFKFPFLNPSLLGLLFLVFPLSGFTKQTLTYCADSSLADGLELASWQYLGAAIHKEGHSGKAFSQGGSVDPYTSWSCIYIYFIRVTFAWSYLYFDVARKESKSEIYESVSTPLCLDHHFISHLRPEKLILSYGDMAQKICTSGWALMAKRTRATH